MAKCDFLTYKGWSGDYCLKKEDYLNKDTVNTYCDNSLRYRDCPIYNDRSSSSGGCYLTTACVECKGLADDCYELTTLRQFRDGYLAEQDGGKEEIQEYYKTAPHIVCRIDASEDAKAVYEDIYSNVIEPCVEFISEGNNEEAHRLYKKMVDELKEKYC